jgi:hypothetical protein
MLPSFAELLGNYVLPAPQRVSDMTFAYCKSQVCTLSVLTLGSDSTDSITAAEPLQPHQQQQKQQKQYHCSHVAAPAT